MNIPVEAFLVSISATYHGVGGFMRLQALAKKGVLLQTSETCHILRISSGIAKNTEYVSFRELL